MHRPGTGRASSLHQPRAQDARYLGGLLARQRNRLTDQLPAPPGFGGRGGVRGAWTASAAAPQKTGPEEQQGQQRDGRGGSAKHERPPPRLLPVVGSVLRLKTAK